MLLFWRVCGRWWEPAVQGKEQLLFLHEFLALSVYLQAGALVPLNCRRLRLSLVVPLVLLVSRRLRQTLPILRLLLALFFRSELALAVRIN